MRGHEDPGLGAVDAGLPGSLGGLDLSLPVQLRGLLAQVPNVARLVLRVPVRRALFESSPLVEPIVDDCRANALDQLRRARDLEHVARALSVLVASVDVG